jgi:uncharacterized cupredoxin-like copper-binding protein
MAARLIALAVATSLLLVACGQSPGNTTIHIRYSRFEPESISGRAGQPLEITLQNDDPIEHEWIVGPEDVHERHRTGTEPYHDAVPTEVTIPALSSRTTTVTFAEPGEYAYICHLPGHEAYGMVGTLQIVGR